MPKLIIRFKKQAESVFDWIKDKLGLMQPKLEDTIGEILNIFKDYAQTYSPVLSGELRDSIEIQWHGMGGEVIPTADHAVFVLFDTAPHSIGSPVFIQDVGWRYIGLSPSGKGKIHPGTTAQDFMSLAWMDGSYEADDIIERFGDWLIE